MLPQPAQAKVPRGRPLTCSPAQTPAHGRAACGTLWTATSIIPLIDRTVSATSPSRVVILDALEILAWPSSTSFFICVCRLIGSWRSADMSVPGATSGLRTLSNVFTYDPTRSALSLSRPSYAAFHSRWDAEGTGMCCSVDSVVVGSASASGSARTAGGARDGVVVGRLSVTFVLGCARLASAVERRGAHGSPGDVFEPCFPSSRSDWSSARDS